MGMLDSKPACPCFMVFYVLLRSGSLLMNPFRLLALLVVVGAACGPLAAAQEKLVIAHRGASGYLPEHTLEAYAMAHALGAHYIEPDLVLTQDDVFICLHDIHLESTTNVETVFPDRHRDDGRWYAIDFTLEEIKQLRAHERLKGRFPQDASRFEIPTFDEMIELIQGLNQGTGRDTGIYPEIKAPQWHADEGHPMEKRLLDTLTRYGYTSVDSKVFVQCFEPDALKKIRFEFESPLQLIQLISDSAVHAALRTESAMTDIAVYANGIGPYKGDIEAMPKLVEWAHAEGLAVHPYTFRADNLPKNYAIFSDELNRFFLEYKVDGVFTDFPDKVLDYLSNDD